MVTPVRLDQKGTSFIELAIALSLSILVVATVFGNFLYQLKVYHTQDQLLDMEQNVRAAMDLLARDLRMSGFGQPTWDAINNDTGITYTVQVTEGGSNPDTLNMVGCFDEPRGTMASVSVSGSTTITLQSYAEASNFNTTTKRDIFIGGLENAKVITIFGPNLTLDTDPDVSGNQGLIYSYPASTASGPVNVYLVRRITYGVDTVDKELTRNENSGAGNQPIASNIEDLQVVYSEPFVTVTLTGRTQHPDPEYTDPIFGDGYRRHSLTMSVRIRNL